VAATLVVYWAALCVGTHLPGHFIASPASMSDKSIHFLAYAVLSFLLAMLMNLMGVRGWRVCWEALLIAVVYGAVDELAQIPIPGRTAELGDWFADVTGALTGVICYWLTMVAARERVSRRWLQKKPSPP